MIDRERGRERGGGGEREREREGLGSFDARNLPIIEDVWQR